MNNNNEVISFIIEMPLYDGDVSNFASMKINNTEQYYNKYIKDISIYFYETCATLQTIHEHCILHMDLKPANLLYSKGSGLFSYKDPLNTNDTHFVITDFGLSCFINDKNCYCVTSYPYMAPELYLFDKKCNQYSDVFSLGMTFVWIILEPIFPYINNKFLLINDLISDYISLQGYKKQSNNLSVKLNTFHKTIKDTIDKIIEKMIQYVDITLDENQNYINPTSSSIIMLLAIKDMISIEIQRPSLNSIINAMQNKDPKLLTHEILPECNKESSLDL